MFQHNSGLAGHPAGHHFPATAPKKQEVEPPSSKIGVEWFSQMAFATRKAKLLRIENIKLPDLSSSAQTSEEMPVLGTALCVSTHFPVPLDQSLLTHTNRLQAYKQGQALGTVKQSNF